jgi:processive 1,2-diacylglycerol beta-glucosyltransferase
MIGPSPPLPSIENGLRPPARPRVLILTAGFGEGHNAAARALGAACDELQGVGTARVLDLLALASPRLNAFTRWAYLKAINRTPRLWSRAYVWMDRSRLLPRSFGLLLRRDRAVLAQILAETDPAVICSSYPVYAFMLEQLRREGRKIPLHFNIVTDSISINSLWWRAGADGWFVPNEDSAAVMRAAGLPADRLHVSGFPVTLFFHRHRGEFLPPVLGAGAPPRVLYIINSGTRGAEATARLLFAEESWDITCAVGRDEQLLRRLNELASGRRRPAQILGWTDAIPRLLLTHHAVISKAGGATTQEAIAACCPMIVSQIVPGQEEGNYELLRRHGAGALAESPEAVRDTLRQLFANRGAQWGRWREAITGLSRPGAALLIAAQVLAAANLAGAAPAGRRPPTA